jgi:hypothetical protein
LKILHIIFITQGGFKTGRLTNHFDRKIKAAIKELASKVRFGIETFKDTEFERLLVADPAFLVCPASIESDDDGLGITINKYKHSMLSYIGSPSQTNEIEGGMKKKANVFFMDKITDIVNNKNIDLTLTQILYKMSAPQESEEEDNEDAKLEMIKATDIKMKGSYSKRVDFQKEDINNFSRQSFDGDHRQLKQLMIMRVDGADKMEVEFNNAHLHMDLRGDGIYSDVAYGGQMKALRSSLMSNEINISVMSKTMSNVAACMWPGRNPLKRLDSEGILIGYTNLSKNSLVPLYWNPENPEYNCKHVAVFGGSGKGKSTMFQYIIWNATGANCDWILFVPKEDFGTSHLDMIEALQGAVIKIGDEDKTFNPFMVFYNPETQGKEPKDRKRAYIKHKGSLIHFFNMRIGSAFSPSMSGTLKRLIKDLYIDAEVIDINAKPIHFEKWDMGETWPSFTELAIKIDNWLVNPVKKNDWPSLKALKGYLTDFEPGEALSFLDNHETFFPSAPRMVIDVSGISEEYQDAITLLLVDMISTRLRTTSAEAYANKKRTIIAFDEGANLLGMPGMAKYIPKMFREARSGKCSIFINQQDPRGIKEILPVIKTNTDALIFFCDMTNEDIAEYEKEFTFSEKDKKILREKGKGKFYFVKNGLKIPGQVILSNTQKRVIFNEDISEQASSEMYSGHPYKLEPGLESIRDEEGVMSADWISEMTDVDIKGFKRVGRFWPVSDDLSRVMWLDETKFTKEVIDGSELIGGESADHWITNALIKGEYERAGCTDVKIHHYGGQGRADGLKADADVTCVTPDGKVLWTEYVHPGSRSPKQIEQQKNNQMRYCDTWIAVCQKDNENDVKAAVGRDFYVLRGSEFRKFVQNIRNTNQGNVKRTSEETEVLNASFQDGTSVSEANNV